MATTSAMAPDGPKLSFAKVAASAKRESAAIHSAPRGPAVSAVPLTAAAPVVAPPLVPAARGRHIVNKATGPPAIAVGSASIRPSGPLAGPSSHSPVAPATAVTNGKTRLDSDNRIVGGLSDLKLETKTPNLVVNGTGSASTEKSSKAGNSQTPSDEVSQKADSSSELDTKPPSLDDKSITSGTTYNVLDEKESLRPDDSASVMAAAEDDDTFSMRGSLVVNSRMGSDVAARVHHHRIQIGDMPPRTISKPVIVDAHTQGAATPQIGPSEHQPGVDLRIPLAAVTSAPESMNQLYQQAPDDKLVEALQSPKDRLFLLRLEKDVISFVQDSKDPYIDLPPGNSFCRMLAHKLADYYHMTHSFDSGFVRIFRTPFCRVPPPLSGINTSSSSTPPPVQPKKIMRRGEDGELAPASAGPSKPTSEVGSDAKDKAPPVILSREEKEEAYNKARERIFGSTGPTETSTPENGDDVGLSRESSVSARDKSSLGKKAKPGRKRTDDTEWDSRSKYQPFYGHPQQPTWVSPQYIPVGNAQFGSSVLQQNFSNPMPTGYSASAQPYQPLLPNNGYTPQVGSMPTYPPQTSQPRYQGPPAPPMAQYPQPAQNVAQPGWQPGFNQSPYQSRAVPAQPGIPYAYGQLPANANPNDPKSQHPIPGSYVSNFSRHGFNPKTQSFVPTGGMSPMQQPTTLAAVPYPVAVPPPGPPVGQAQLSFAGYQQPMPQPPPFGANGAEYGMMRQGSNGAMPPYHAPQHIQQPGYQVSPATHGPPHPLQHMPPQNPASHIPTRPAVPVMGNAQVYVHLPNLPNYGNPATLPQRPST